MPDTTESTTPTTTVEPDVPDDTPPPDETALEAPNPDSGAQPSGETTKAASKAELPPEAAEKISKANREAQNLRKRLKELEPKARQWDAAQAANRTEAEQLTDQLAKAEARAQAAVTSAVDAEIRAAAHGWANPSDAPRYLDDKATYVGEDGQIDTTAIAEDVAAALKDRPYLAASTTGSGSDRSRRGPSPDPGQGARGQASIDEQIRAAESQGDHRQALRLKTARLLNKQR